MKINMPVTDHEIMFEDSQFMLTKTDLKGVITYANKDFIAVSGFSEAELVGSSHNMVRHPDMPVEAFADMWRSLKSGKPWTGMVKNRTKSGDFYWVEANAAPIEEAGVVTGFLSVRRKPSRQKVEAATAAYRMFKDGQAKGLTIMDGKVVKNSITNKVKRKLFNIKLGQRLAGIILLGVAALVIQAGIGLYEIGRSNDSVKTIQEDRLVPTRDLGQISRLMMESESLLRTALSEVEITNVAKTSALTLKHDEAKKAADAISENIATINGLWKAYSATSMTSEEKLLADNFSQGNEKFVNEGLIPAVKALQANNYDEAMKYSDIARDLFNSSEPVVQVLLRLQNDVALKEYKDAEANFQRTRILTFSGLTLITIILIYIGWLVTRSITKPLEQSIGTFNKIISGNYASAIDVKGDNELSKVLQSLQTMQTILSVNENTLKESAIETKEQAAMYEGQLAAISKSTGVIEFNMDGTVIAANDIFLNVLGYSRAEAIGQHHSAFVEPKYRESAEYKEFWNKWVSVIHG